MSVEVIAWVFKNSRSKGVARLVLLAMADEAASTGELSAYRRSQSWIASKANVSVRTVRRAVDDLVALGELEVVSLGLGHKSTDYLIPMREDTTSSLEETPPSSERTPRPLSERTPRPLSEDTTSSPSSRSSQIPPVTSLRSSSEGDSGASAEAEPQGLPKPRKRRPSDDVFDALVEVSGMTGSEMTKSACSGVAKVANELVAVGASAEDVHRRAAAFRAKYPNIDVTPHALGKHWSRLTPPRHRDAGRIFEQADGRRVQIQDDGTPRLLDGDE